MTQRYGADHVGQIATFHSLKARGLVRDVCRVMGLQPSEANDIAKAVPEGPKVTLSMALADPAALKEKVKKHPELAGKLQDAIMIAEGSGKLRARAKEDAKVAEARLNAFNEGVVSVIMLRDNAGSLELVSQDLSCDVLPN